VADDIATMAARVEPFIRRAVLQGRTTGRLTAMVAGEPLDLLTFDIEPESKPGDLAAEVESTLVTDGQSADAAAYYRVEVEGGDKPGASLTLRPPSRRKAGAEPDVAEMVWPRGSDARDALLRQAMRHSEMAVARAVTAQDRALVALTSGLEQLAKTNESLRAQLTRDAEAAGNHLRATAEAEGRLLESAARGDALREAGRTLRYLAPRIVDGLSGADKYGPALRVIAKLTPDQIENGVKLGLLSAEDAEALAELWHDLKDEKRDRRALRGDTVKPASVVRLAPKRGEGDERKEG
jgi:hypothetical protein